MIKMLDKKADELLAKVGIKNKDLQNVIEVGGLVLLGYAIYRAWKKNSAEKKPTKIKANGKTINISDLSEEVQRQIMEE